MNLDVQGQSKKKRKHTSSKKMAKKAKKRGNSNARGNKSAQKAYAKGKKERMRLYEEQQAAKQKNTNPIIIAEKPAAKQKSGSTTVVAIDASNTNNGASSGAQSLIIKRLREENSKLKTQLTYSNAELAQLKSGTQVPPIQMDNDADELSKANRDLNDKLYAQATTINELRDELSSLKQGNRQEAVAIAVGGTSSVLRNENDELAFHLKELESELNTTKTDLAHLQKLNNDLISNSGNMDPAVNKELNYLRKDNRTKEKEIERLSYELSNLSNKETSVLANYGEDSNSLLEVIENLKSDISSKNSQINQLETSVESMRTIKQQLDRPMNDFNLKPINGIVFRIQIGAYGNRDLSRFNDVDKQSFIIEEVNGVQRYFVGYFDDYWKADDFKGQLRQIGVADAFVAAFRDGKRITMRAYIDEFRASR